ncbi:MAG: hypothetical protein GXY41_01200 [Phycisphaerae bacterium]|nr:hypothetical protein [Phycisphaerae bacterium]
MKRYLSTVDPKILERLLKLGAAGAVVWLTVMVFNAGAQSLDTPGKAETAIREYDRIRTDVSAQQYDPRAQIQQLSRNSLFNATPTPTTEVRVQTAQLPQTQAILGDAVLIGDQWYSVGQTVQGYEIAWIGPDSVILSLDGVLEELVPFNVEVNYGQPARGTAQQGGRAAQQQRQRPGGMGEMPGGMGGMGIMGGFGDFTIDRVNDLRNRFEGMAPDQRQDMLNRFVGGSPEERIQMIREFF